MATRTSLLFSYVAFIAVFVGTCCHAFNFARVQTNSMIRKDLFQLHSTPDNTNPSSQVKKYCLNVNLYIKPERREDFIKTIRINTAGTRTNEPLNCMYLWGESTTEKNTFHFQEQFYGKEGFLAHENAPHFAVWKQFADAKGDDSPFSKPPVIHFFEEME